MFGIAPINRRSLLNFEGGELDIDRGPCKFISDLYGMIILCLFMHKI